MLFLTRENPELLQELCHKWAIRFAQDRFRLIRHIRKRASYCMNSLDLALHVGCDAKDSSEDTSDDGCAAQSSDDHSDKRDVAAGMSCCDPDKSVEHLLSILNTLVPIDYVIQINKEYEVYVREYVLPMCVDLALMKVAMTLAASSELHRQHLVGGTALNKHGIRLCHKGKPSDAIHDAVSADACNTATRSGFTHIMSPNVMSARAFNAAAVNYRKALQSNTKGLVIVFHAKYSAKSNEVIDMFQKITAKRLLDPMPTIAVVYAVAEPELSSLYKVSWFPTIVYIPPILHRQHCHQHPNPGAYTRADGATPLPTLSAPKALAKASTHSTQAPLVKFRCGHSPVVDAGSPALPHNEEVASRRTNGRSGTASQGTTATPGTDDVARSPQNTSMGPRRSTPTRSQGKAYKIVSDVDAASGRHTSASPSSRPDAPSLVVQWADKRTTASPPTPTEILFSTPVGKSARNEFVTTPPQFSSRSSTGANSSIQGGSVEDGVQPLGEDSGGAERDSLEGILDGGDYVIYPLDGVQTVPALVEWISSRGASVPRLRKMKEFFTCIKKIRQEEKFKRYRELHSAVVTLRRLQGIKDDLSVTGSGGNAAADQPLFIFLGGGMAAGKTTANLLVKAINQGRSIVLDGTMMWKPFVQQVVAMVRDAHLTLFKQGPGYNKKTQIEQYFLRSFKLFAENFTDYVRMLVVHDDAAFQQFLRQQQINDDADTLLGTRKYLLNAFPQRCVGELIRRGPSTPAVASSSLPLDPTTSYVSVLIVWVHLGQGMLPASSRALLLVVASASPSQASRWVRQSLRTNAGTPESIMPGAFAPVAGQRDRAWRSDGAAGLHPSLEAGCMMSMTERQRRAGQRRKSCFPSRQLWRAERCVGGYNIPAILYVVLQFVAFFFVLVGTPLDIFRDKSPNGFGKFPCFSLWGIMFNCTLGENMEGIDAYAGCPLRMHQFRAAEAFVIISIVVYGAAFILGLILLFCCPLLRRVCLTLNIVGVVTLCVVWALVVEMYHKDANPRCQKFKEGASYSSAFVLFVLAWILDVINIFLLLLPFAGPVSARMRVRKLRIGYNIPAILYVVLQFVAFFFVLVGTPLDIFRDKSPNGFGKFPCFSLWGIMFNCTLGENMEGIDAYAGCPLRMHQFRAAEAFVIISIVVYGAAFILGLILLFCCPLLRRVCLTLNIVGVVTLCVVWALVVEMYHKDANPRCQKFKEGASYSSAFVLFVLAWILDVINIFLLLLPFAGPVSARMRVRKLRIGYNIPAILYVVLQFVAFFFVLVGTPLDIFRDKSPNGFGKFPCFSLWGIMFNCTLGENMEGIDAYAGCPLRMHQFRAAEAFVIISIVVYGAAFILGLILLFCCPLLRRVCLTLNIVGVVTLCVVWALVVEMYHKDANPRCQKFKEGASYSSAFVLFVLAWILDVINIFLLLLPFAGPVSARMRVRKLRIGYNIPAILYVVLQFVAFFFVLVGTPLDIFRDKSPNGFGKFPCFSLWGIMFNCTLGENMEGIDAYAGCPLRMHQFRAAEAFVIISIVVYGAAFILGLILLFCCPLLRRVCLTLNIVGVVTLCVVWALVVEMYHKDANPRCQKFKEGASYSSAFVLFVLAWILDVINIFLLLLPFAGPVSARMRVRKLRIGYNIPAILYVVLQFVAFFFVLVGTPLDIFRDKSPNGFGKFPCFSLWGIMFNCTLGENMEGIDAYAGCPLRMHQFRAAEAFVIISIVVYGAAFILGLILLFCCPLLRRVCLTLNIVGVVTLCVVWALVVEMYHKDANPRCQKFKEGASYSSAFVLFVLAWILDVINIFLLLLPFAGPVSARMRVRKLRIGYNIPAILYVVLQFVAFFFVLVGTPLDIFRDKSPNGFGKFPCFSLWGIMFNCTLGENMEGIDAYAGCPLRMHQFRAAEAFVIISIVVYGAAFILGLILLFCCPLLRRVCLTLNIVGVVTLCVVWALVVEMYHKDANPRCQKFKEGASYSSAFVLFVLAWILDVINIFLLLLPFAGPVSARMRVRKLRIGYNIPAILYVVLQFVAFFFVLVGTPLDIFRDKSPNGFGKFPCFSLWGIMFNCTLGENMEGIDAYAGCPLRMHQFRAAEAFVIISIVVYGAAFILGLILLFCCPLLRRVCLTLNIVGYNIPAILYVVLQFVAFFFVLVGTPLDIFRDKSPNGFGCPLRMHQFRAAEAFVIISIVVYGAASAFVLFVLAWILDVINIFLLLLPFAGPVSARMRVRKLRIGVCALRRPSPLAALSCVHACAARRAPGQLPRGGCGTLSRSADGTRRLYACVSVCRRPLCPSSLFFRERPPRPRPSLAYAAVVRASLFSCVARGCRPALSRSSTLVSLSGSAMLAVLSSAQREVCRVRVRVPLLSLSAPPPFSCARVCWRRRLTEAMAQARAAAIPPSTHMHTHTHTRARWQG
ncbi:Amastin surface glycofamily protein [Leishmania donovani]|uniref:Amastin surface glycofamily protein n=1 Tax=Leishmania donovani TaxID=5661 RepID=A0A504XVR6_LEIDO|nr:Amastin surface glycofamily protein [Leishmania donovani]